MEDLKIRVIQEPSEENPFAVIYKPHNLPTAPLREDDRFNALSQAAELFPLMNRVSGKKAVERGLVHRLDTVTSGLILIATDQSFYDRLLQIQGEDRFIKYYRAQCDVCKDNADTLEAFPPFAGITGSEECNDIVYTKSWFRPYGDGQKEVRPVTQDSGMAALKKLKNRTEYSTEIKILSSNNADANVLCRISRGYRHQVRCHLAWAGYPVKNDPIYNSLCKNQNLSHKDISFEACAFEFPHPFTGEILRFEI